MKNKIDFKNFFKAYKKLFKIIMSVSPMLVIMTFVISIISGFMYPMSLKLNEHIFDDGLKVAAGEIQFSQYSILLILLVFITILPNIVNIVIYGLVERRSQLILKTHYKAKMLKKLKRLKYEHFENESSIEIMDKAFTRTENAARHLFPMYVLHTVSSSVALLGLIYLIYQTKWWLLLSVFIPLVVETYLTSKDSYNIYSELEKYYKMERKYSTLGKFLRSRDHIRELKLFQGSDFLLDRFKERMGERNRKYESYYLGNLKRFFFRSNLSRFFAIVNAVAVLLLFVNGQITIGRFIAISSMMFGPVQGTFSGAFHIFKSSANHIKFFEYYDKFFALSEETESESTLEPKDYSIEFKNVWFKYPETDQYILKGLSFKLEENEKLSIVGENGEGKSTMIKLLLGLFTPDEGDIIIGGRDISEYSRETLTSIFAPIFQDFKKYSISLKENITIGGDDTLSDDQLINAMEQSKVTDFAYDLPDGVETILGRDFDGGIDISGGQWQRVAIARGLVGNKKIIVLDEPTSQLDPVAESKLYQEFADLVNNKTAIFITHRLASTMITDRIVVIHDGVIEEEGNHESLMERSGRYAQMFNAQKQWYQKEGTLVNV